MPHITHELKALNNPVYVTNRNFVRNHKLEVDLEPIPIGITSTGYRIGAIALANRPEIRNPITGLFEWAHDWNPVLLDARNYHEIRTTVLEELEHLSIISTERFTNLCHPHIGLRPRPINPDIFTRYENYCTPVPSIASGTIDLLMPITLAQNELPLMTNVPIEIEPSGRVRVYENITVVQPNDAPFRRPTFFQECARYHLKNIHNLVTLYHSLRESHATNLFAVPQVIAPAASIPTSSRIQTRSSINQLL